MKSHTKRELEGIGGWLLVYFILFVLGFIWTIFIITGFFILKSYLFFFLSFLVGVSEFYALYLFLRKRKKAIKWNMFALWFGFVVYSLTQISSILSVNFSQISLEDLLVYLGGQIGGFIGGGGYTIIYFLYWRKSKRVKNTFVK